MLCSRIGCYFRCRWDVASLFSRWHFSTACVFSSIFGMHRSLMLDTLCCTPLSDPYSTHKKQTAKRQLVVVKCAFFVCANFILNGSTTSHVPCCCFFVANHTWMTYWLCVHLLISAVAAHIAHSVFFFWYATLFLVFSLSATTIKYSNGIINFIKRSLASVDRLSSFFYAFLSTLHWLIYGWLTVIVCMHNTVATLKYAKKKNNMLDDIFCDQSTQRSIDGNRIYRFDWAFMGQWWCVRMICKRIWWMKGKFMS